MLIKQSLKKQKNILVSRAAGNAGQATVKIFLGEKFNVRANIYYNR